MGFSFYSGARKGNCHMQSIRCIEGVLRTQQDHSAHTNWRNSCRIRWTTDRTAGNYPERRQDGSHWVQSVLYRITYIKHAREWRLLQQRMQWRTWLEMKPEAKVTVTLCWAVDSELESWRLLLCTRAHRNFKQGNYRIIFELYNFSLSSCERWIRRGIIGDREMCCRSKKILWMDIYGSIKDIYLWIKIMVLTFLPIISKFSAVKKYCFCNKWYISLKN